jgi:hypothetical protein
MPDLDVTDRGRIPGMTKVGTRVELPRLLSVLAHETRGAVGVIQGYVRIMMRDRDASHPDMPMLKGVLDASARLTAISRQASDLVTWAASRVDLPPQSGRLGDLSDEAVAQSSGRLSARLSEPEKQLTLRVLSLPALAAAVAAVADFSAREAGRPVVLSVAPASDPTPSAGGADRDTGTIQLRIAAEGATPAAESSGPFPFDRGGLGLALVLASYVFDAHDAHVTAAEPSRAVGIALQKEGSLP